MYNKSFFALILLIISVFFCGCNNVNTSDQSKTTSGSASRESTAAVSENNGIDTIGTAGTSSEKTDDGGWPFPIYSALGIDEIKTETRKIICTAKEADSARYCVFYNGVTYEEYKVWHNELISKGFRLPEYEKENENEFHCSDYYYYFPNEKSSYRIVASFSFDEMRGITYDPRASYQVYDAEFTGDVIGETNEYGEKIFRNELTVGLEPLNTEKQFEGESEEFGLTAQDYIINDSVRKVSITSDGEITKLRVDFYDDHLTTPEEFDLIKTIIVTKLSESGFAFFYSSDSEYSREIPVSEVLNRSLSNIFHIVKGNDAYFVDGHWNGTIDRFGVGYSLRLTLITPERLKPVV